MSDFMYIELDPQPKLFEWIQVPTEKGKCWAHVVNYEDNLVRCKLHWDSLIQL